MKLEFDTKLVHGDLSFDEATGAISYPIYQSATFKHRGFKQSTGFDYSREDNPTRQKLENTIAVLEGAEAGFAFSTGMAAVANVLQLFSTGDHLIISNDLYGGSYRLFEELLHKQYRLEFTYVDTRSLEGIEAAIKENTKGIFIETPTNPMMRVSDIRKIAEISKSRGLLLIVDNTFLTPYFQKPLELGADIVLHSGTKFLGGHNDTLAGFVAVRAGEQLSERMKLIQKTVGGVLSPFDSWLLLRGIKTLGIRMERQQENAFKIAAWLKANNKIAEVYYPGLASHEGHGICKSQASGFGSMISFSVKDAEIIPQILEGVKVISFAESLGGVESLITYPLVQTHAAIPKAILDELGVNERLLRLSVGIEDVKDLIEDLDKAIGK